MERRKLDRRRFSYYMRVLNETTGELVGHLADISTGGFKLDTQTTVPPGVDYLLRIDLTGEVANKAHMVFKARSKWCRQDSIDTRLYNVGFQIVDMAPGDMDIFIRMFERYGTGLANEKDDLDYLWK